MADNSLIRDLLKTPEQLRAERFDQLRESARARAQLMGGGPATTALPGLLTGLAQQSMVAQAPMAEQMRQRGLLGLSSIAGAIPSGATRSDGIVTPIDTRSMTTGTPRELTTQMPDGRNKELARELAVASMTPEERVQAQTRGILQAGGTKKPEELLKLAEQLRAAGRFDLAETFETRAKGLADAAKDTARRKAVAERLGNSTDPRLRELAVLALDPDQDILELLEQERQIVEGDKARTITEELVAVYDGIVKATPSIQKQIEALSSKSEWFGLVTSVDVEKAGSITAAAAQLAEDIQARDPKISRLDALKQAVKQLSEELKKAQTAKTPKNNPALKKQDVLPEDEARSRATEGASA